MALLSCTGISLDLGGRRILEDVTLSVGEAEVVGLAGPNGAGKTSLFEVLSGRQLNHGGDVLLDGTSIRLDAEGVIEIAGVQLAEGLGPWFRSADLGEFEAGKLRVLGRRDRVINSGGVKLALDLVERVVLEMPGVEDCAAVALEDAEWGQRVGLLIVGSPQSDAADRLRDRLGVAAVPKRTVVAPQLPRLDSGKPDYESARELLLG